MIRSYTGMATRIPDGWTCFSACNFVFMGGDRRFVDPGGVFMVHMFTHTGDRETIQIAAEEGTAETVRLIAEIEQSSALLATAQMMKVLDIGYLLSLVSGLPLRQHRVPPLFIARTRR